MTSTTGQPGPEPDPYVTWDAAYVLGALGPAERREYEAHLSGCDACREAVGQVAGLPGLLGALPPDEAEALAGETPLPAGADVVPLDALARAARRSRARRRSLLAVAASALAVAGLLTGLTLDDGPDGAGDAPVVAAPADARVELEPVGSGDVRASLVATSRPWGTLMEWSCRYGSAPPEKYEPVTYELVVVDRDGTRTVAATWGSSGEHAAGLRAASAVALADVARVEIAVVGAVEPLASADV